ncbi:MAG: hypothetical protein R3231_12510, partial [bacterium]|nr:hypothetical protein [bacterium]
MPVSRKLQLGHFLLKNPVASGIVRRACRRRALDSPRRLKPCNVSLLLQGPAEARVSIEREPMTLESEKIEGLNNSTIQIAYFSMEV